MNEDNNGDLRPKPAEKRDIPDGIKREVRQRCGFGCVICGLPLYEYEHMEEFAIVRRHVADEITLLCDRHHREKTNKLLSISKVRRFNANPINKRGTTEPYPFHIEGKDTKLIVGDNTFLLNSQAAELGIVPLSIDDHPLISMRIEDGQLLLNLNIYDKDNNLLLRILDNELIASTQRWDIEFSGRTLTIRDASRDISFKLKVSPNDQLIVLEKAKLSYNGFEVLVDGSSKNGSIGGFASGNVIIGGKFLNFSSQKAIKPADINDETVRLDGNRFINQRFNRCTLEYAGGTLPIMQGCYVNESTFNFIDSAENTINFLRMLHLGGFQEVSKEVLNAITCDPKPPT